MIDRAFSPHRCPLSPETQADGLGWYGVAPSVLGFPATRASASKAHCCPLPRPQELKDICRGFRALPGISLRVELIGGRLYSGNQLDTSGFMSILQAVRGTRDLLPAETGLWNHIETTARGVFERYSFGEIRTPILEDTQLFSRGVGEGTDIVSKEMYTFTR